MTAIFVTRTALSVLRTVDAYLAEHGYSPTVREISQRHGWRSPHAAQGQLVRLIKAGLLSRGPGARTHRVTEAGRKLIQEVADGV
jgi:SOS-response transcriptional repressor LexA